MQQNQAEPISFEFHNRRNCLIGFGNTLINPYIYTFKGPELLEYLSASTPTVRKSRQIKLQEKEQKELANALES